ncbi:hypothetical protein FLAG1_10008 [Fusarium langsethiae]|uniref:F-box domain-containing protein n=1 Tax=Fusarium langsethiae TaxID=179993 RepID=A0A0N0DBS6_FUSLA|nr:hypothetical protein FLAG1_10008 [Fusarium langsethiae]GKU07242.1 unnamed protein product [Fusarium langsethiae]
MGLLLLLPAELQNAIYDFLDVVSIKNLRTTCRVLAKAVPLHFNRVFISANSLNIQVFKAIANHETFRHQVTKIIWDDASLPTRPELEAQQQGQEETEYDSDIQNEPLRWFRDWHDDYCDWAFWGYCPENHLSLKESWVYYKPLIDDQTRILSSNADIEAFNYGLRRFTSLRRVTITPSTHGRYESPLYRTPMIRAFPPGFDYPVPEPGHSYDHRDQRWYDIDVHPWVYHGDDNSYKELYGVKCTAEEYRNQWRGFWLVMRALKEYDGHSISELVVGGNEIRFGLNYRIFDQWSLEYSYLVALLKRPGFRHLDLHLFTGLLEEDDWLSFQNGLLHDALAQAKDLEYLSLRSDIEIFEGTWEGSVEEERGEKVLPLRSIFRPDCWPRLQHFGITNMIVDLDDFISLLTSMPPSLRSVEINDVTFESPEHGYDDLLCAMRHTLDWRLRPIEERPKVQMRLTIGGALQELGRFVQLDQTISSYLYGTGDNPFESKFRPLPGRGAVQIDVFDPDFEEPF